MATTTVVGVAVGVGVAAKDGVGSDTGVGEAVTSEIAVTAGVFEAASLGTGVGPVVAVDSKVTVGGEVGISPSCVNRTPSSPLDMQATRKARVTRRKKKIIPAKMDRSHLGRHFINTFSSCVFQNSYLKDRMTFRVSSRERWLITWAKGSFSGSSNAT